MATLIPRVQGPSVEAQQGPSIRVQAPDLGAGVRLGQQALGAANQYFQQQVEINDTTAIMGARSQLSAWESSTFDPNNPDGITKYQGKNALGARDALVPDLQKTISSISDGLTPRQRQQFLGVAENFSASFNSRLNGYADREHSQYLQAEQKSAISNLTQDAVAAGMAGDFNRQDSVGVELLAMARANAMAQGFGEELIKAQERGLVSTIRASTIENVATTNPFEAQAYYERYADQMTPEDRARADRLLYPVVSDAHAQEVADSIIGGRPISEYRDPGQRGAKSPSPQVVKIIEEEAAAAGVPPEVMMALAEQESGFNPDAVNPEVLDDGDQATGLFQYRATSAGGIDRKDARASARRAAQEFAKRSKQGGVEFAVAAHFAGEGGADAVVNRGRTAENPKTARYISEVMGRAARWRGEAPAQPVAISSPPSEAAAIERAQQIRDPRQRAAVLGKIRERFNLSDLRKQEEDRALTESAYVAINQSSNPNAPLREQLGAPTYAWAVRTGKLNTLEEMRKRKITGQFVQDDPVLAEQLERQAALQPEEFAKRNLYEMADKLSTETITQLLAKQKAANDPSKRADWMNDTERLDRGFQMLGISRDGDAAGSGSGKKNQPRDVLRGEFRIAYQNAQTQFIQNTGKKPTPEQSDVLLNSTAKLFSQRLQAGQLPSMLDEDGRLKNNPKVKNGIYSSAVQFDVKVSQADRDAVRTAYSQKYGRPPTDAWVTQYLARKSQGEKK